MRFTYPPDAKPVDGYTLRRGIHRGGFGEVYYAVSDAGKEVALKLLTHDLETELRGIRQCLNLKHPNLVTIFDVKTDGEGDTWVVMEYIHGASLEDVLAAFPMGLPLDEVREWMIGMLAGVAYLHDRGIVHRDLKPANVYRENGVVKIGDVGLSKQMGGTRRQHTEAVGTVYYMAPEVAKGQYGPEVDIYSLGVMLYEMLTSRLPFDGETTAEILMKHLSSAPDLSIIPTQFRRVLAATLEKDPAKRIRHARQFQEELDRVEPAGPAVEIPESAFLPVSTSRPLPWLPASSPPPIPPDPTMGTSVPQRTAATDSTGKWSTAQSDTRSATQGTSAVNSTRQAGRSIVSEVLSSVVPEIRERVQRRVEKELRRHERRTARREARAAATEARREAARRHSEAWAQNGGGWNWLDWPLAILGVLFLLVLLRGGGQSAPGWLFLALAGGFVTAAMSRRWSRPSEKSPEEAPLAPLSVTGSIEQLAKGVLLAAISAAALSFVLYNVFVAFDPRMNQLSESSVLFLGAASLISTCGLLLTSLYYRTRGTTSWSEWGWEAAMSGAAVGLIVGGLDDFMFVDFGSVAGRGPIMFPQIGTLPMIVQPGDTTVFGYMAFFAIAFWMPRWGMILNPFRSQRFRVAPVVWSALWAWMLTLAFGMPMVESLHLMLVTTVAAQVSSPWRERPLHVAA